MSIEDAAPISIPDAFAGLVREHAELLATAKSLEEYGRAVGRGSAPASDLVRFTTFFREYGSLIHHEKEERIAFAAMSLHGFQPGSVPRAQLHESHEKEHHLLLHLIRFAVSTTPAWDDSDRQRVLQLTADYGEYLRSHLEDEEERLYPALRQTLTGAELDSVARKIHRFNEEHDQSGQLSWLLSLAAELREKYPAS